MARSIPTTESLTVEFKSDRQRLSDDDIAAAVVCLANTDGGHIYLGVEDDGTITGLHTAHQNIAGLAAMIANRTNPPISVRTALFHEEGLPVAVIEVPRSTRLAATSSGLLQRRRLMADGTPGCVPFYPHEFAIRQSALGHLDYSALPVADATLDDFDPLERERLRQLIETYNGDRTLLALEDGELDAVLGFTRREEGRIVPTVAGLLALGREAALRQHIPTHEIAFQVLDGTQVRVNDFYHTPLLKTFELVMQQFESRIEEDELQVGLFRVPIPTFDSRVFREALINAVVHRDYARLAAVYVRMEDDTLVISNPGGFVEGVTLENLLVTEPRPRNPLLADAIKRIGLAERTGRGVDLIYQWQLFYGRPAPDYSRSDPNSVIVRLSGGYADKELIRVIVEQQRRANTILPVDALIAVAHLRKERRIDTATLARAIQKDESAARTVLERLVEAGLVEAHGIKKGRTYTLSPRLYRELGQPADYVRQAGFDLIQQEQMIRQYVKKHGIIRRKDVIDLCKIGDQQASRLLTKLTKRGILDKQGEGKGTYYQPGPSL
jgi:ATP-dependent DNA helicase RecG